MKYHIPLIIIFFFFFSINLAQVEKPLNNPIYDNQPYHFGFTLGLSNNKFQINYSEAFINQDGISQILSEYEPGFNVGIIIDFRMSNNTNLRLTPSFNFTDQKLYYTKNNITSIQPSNNTGVSHFEIPVYIKYRSERINNGRVYLLMGGKFMLDMSSVEKLTQSGNLKFKKTNYSIDIGFGIDVYFAYFKFSPEIKYSYGIVNVLENQDNEYSNLINELSTRGLLISLTFE
tara:strand:+ start:687 stop:1379 length:693 start_codon:yes stop_codon:yes gene_type:complete